MTPAENLTGYLLPPEHTAERWFTVWRPDWLWIALAVTAAYLYLKAARILHRRGDKWRWIRSAAWLAGLAGLVFFTSGGPSVYGRVLFSGHDGSRGLREWLMVLVHSRVAAVLTHPLFAAANFLLAAMAFHAFFGVTLTGSTTVIQPEWFTGLGRDWGLPALEDQQIARAITWGIGAIPTVLVAIGVALTWSREMRRTDRAADRNNDADLEACNTKLGRLDRRGVPAQAPHDHG